MVKIIFTIIMSVFLISNPFMSVAFAEDESNQTMQLPEDAPQAMDDNAAEGVKQEGDVGTSLDESENNSDSAPALEDENNADSAAPTLDEPTGDDDY